MVTIQPAGGTARQFAAITTEIENNEPDYPGESIPNTAGGRIWNQKPQEDGEITLKLYPIQLDDQDNAGAFQYFHGGTIDSSQPLQTNKSYTAGISKQRETYIVALMWTDDTAVTSAMGATSTSAKVALRFYCKLARMVSHKSTFDPENGLVITATFKYPPMNKAGSTKTFRWESVNDASTPLASVTYTSATDL